MVTTAKTELEIFGRLIRSDDREMPPTLARYVIGLDFATADKVRMQKLATKNQEGELSRTEKAELEAWVNAGHLLAAFQSKARQSLRKRRSTRG